MSKTQEIIDNLLLTLPKITKANGYQTDVVEVNDKLQKFTEASNLITLNVIAGNDILKEELEENEIRQVEIIILAHCNETDGDGILTDINKFLYSDLSINPNYVTSLNTITDLQKVLITLKNNNYVWQSNKKTVLTKLVIEFYQDKHNI